MLSAACWVLRARAHVRTCGVPRATCEVRRATCGVPRAACDVLRATCLVTVVLAAACGDSPSGPGPIVNPPPPPTPNAPPVIDTVTVSASRVEADTEVTVTAAVRDAETPLEQLAYEWKADAGTFTGTGASVRWRAPKGTQTPATYLLTLTVTETYGSPTSAGVRPQHSVTASSPEVRVHDSPREIGDMALRFLRLFANSSVSPDTALQEFSDSCSGKRAEKADLEDNRRDFDILSSSLNLTNARVSIPWARGDATVRCAFSSRRKFCPADAPPNCRVGTIESVEGNCNLTTVYEQQRWLLCDSTFQGQLLPSMRGFFGRSH